MKFANRALTIFVFSALILSSVPVSFSGAPPPEFENITVQPGEPVAGDNVEISVTVSGWENFDSISVLYGECSPEICYVEENVRMEKIGENRYRAILNLFHEDAIYLDYKFAISSGGQVWDHDNYRGQELAGSGGQSGDGDEQDGETMNWPLISAGLVALLAVFLVVLAVRKRG